MLDFLFHVPLEKQKKVLLEFIKPICAENIQKKKIHSFDYFTAAKRIRLSVVTKDEKALEKEFQVLWSLFLEKEASYFSRSDYKPIDTLFQELPISHLKVTLDSTNLNETDHHNFSLTNLEVLEELNENEYDLEYSICLFFTFMYCLGGFSPRHFFELAQELRLYKQFDAQTFGILNAQADAIIDENREEIIKRLLSLFQELLLCQPQNDLPSVFSKWKFSYGKITLNKEEDLIPVFEHFKSQLLFSDSEAHIILSIILNFMGGMIHDEK